MLAADPGLPAGLPEWAPGGVHLLPGQGHDIRHRPGKPPSLSRQSAELGLSYSSHSPSERNESQLPNRLGIRIVILVAIMTNQSQLVRQCLNGVRTHKIDFTRREIATIVPTRMETVASSDGELLVSTVSLRCMNSGNYPTLLMHCLSDFLLPLSNLFWLLVRHVNPTRRRESSATRCPAATRLWERSSSRFASAPRTTYATERRKCDASFRLVLASAFRPRMPWRMQLDSRTRVAQPKSHTVQGGKHCD